MRTIPPMVALVAYCLLFVGCGEAPEDKHSSTSDQSEHMKIYTSFRLEADLSHLSENQRKMIPILIEAAEAMDEVFWLESFGNRDELLASIESEDLRRFAEVNYGPWDRLDGNRPFLDSYGEKPLGARYYPSDMTKEEFDAACAADADFCRDLRSQYTIVRRKDDGTLYTIPFHLEFSAQHQRAADKLREAAALAEDEGFRRYLEARADALLNDDYQPSDVAWMEMKSNVLDVVIGPIEHYEDKLFNFKTAHEAYVLVKDLEWSKKLERYAAFLPSLQEGLPVPPEYKKENPGSESDLGAYDVIYYAGDCNAGSKTIAINLPNDEHVQLTKGTRRLQLKNAMRAKFDKILLLIADELIDESQRSHITFDAFFANTMFHEVAHGLGIKQTITDRGTVREALKELGSSFEEGKADVLGLYMLTALRERGEITEGDLMDNYVTFLAGIFRSVRFGAASAHGKANMVRFNFFQESGAFSRDDASGRYRVDAGKMAAAVNDLARRILMIQGDGNFDAAHEFMEKYGSIAPTLQGDIDRLAEAGIPIDIVFEQGVDVLGLGSEHSR